MAKEFAGNFYVTQAWKKCRNAYISYAGGLCERCLRNGLIVPGKIVHHKIHLTPETIKDPRMAYGFDNLELLCEACHADEHAEDIKEGNMKYLRGKQRKQSQRYRIDEYGKVIY